MRFGILRRYYRYSAFVGLAAVIGLAGCAEGQFENRKINTTGLSRIENPDARIGMLKTALAQDPQNSNTLKSLGTEYAAVAKWQESAAAYREALILKNNDNDALVGHAKALAAQGNYQPALVSARKAISGRASSDAYVAAGIAEDGLGRQAEAQAYYQRALAENGRDLDVRSNIALSKALTGDQSAYSLMGAVALAPDADQRHKGNMVLVSALLGRMQDARAFGAKFGFTRKEVRQIIKLAGDARVKGASAFGVARR